LHSLNTGTPGKGEKLTRKEKISFCYREYRTSGREILP
jgi:hypothetical protein